MGACDHCDILSQDLVIINNYSIEILKQVPRGNFFGIKLPDHSRNIGASLLPLIPSGERSSSRRIGLGDVTRAVDNE
jgi:hypothetical protein